MEKDGKKNKVKITSILLDIRVLLGELQAAIQQLDEVIRKMMEE